MTTIANFRQLVVYVPQLCSIWLLCATGSRMKCNLLGCSIGNLPGNCIQSLLSNRVWR